MTTVTSKDQAVAPRKYTPRLPPEERKDQILDAVLEVISEQGTSAVSVDGIARRLGFTRPVVYALFTDADHMLRESLKREEQRAIAQMAGILPLGASGSPDAVTEAFRAYLQAVLDEPARWRAILLPIGSTPTLLKTVRRGRRQLVQLLTAILEPGLPPQTGIDFELAAHMLLTLGEEAGRLVLTDPEAFPPDRLAGFAGTLAGLAARALPPRAPS